VSAPLLHVERLVKTYPAAGGLRVLALQGVDLEVGVGEIVGLVGESGCGKSTLGRCVLRLEEPDSGRVIFDGVELTQLSQRALRARRRRMQLIFQDPFSSLDPRLTAEAIVGEPLAIHRLVRGRRQRREEVTRLLAEVGLPADALARYPHEFSGGQRQRLGIARALAARPELIVADEPVSALDVSVQAQILNLLAELQRRGGLSYLFISHDLRVVRHLCARVLVMYLGRIVEEAPAQRLAVGAAHPYTRALLAAVPALDAGTGRRLLLAGEAPSPVAPPAGCAFHPRCPVFARRRNVACERELPTLAPVDGAAHRVACHEARGDASVGDPS
jgi:peptide/nickel transport system ATP-binding protein